MGHDKIKTWNDGENHKVISYVEEAMQKRGFFFFFLWVEIYYRNERNMREEGSINSGIYLMEYEELGDLMIFIFNYLSQYFWKKIKINCWIVKMLVCVICSIFLNSLLVFALQVFVCV